MKTRPPRKRLLSAIAHSTLMLSVIAVASAQTAAPASSAETSASAKPVPAGKSGETLDDAIVLSPFEVKSDRNEGYRATSSLAGSRLNTSLKDISSPISVITPQFLQDTGATNVQSLLIYTTNTEVAGTTGNFYGSNAGDVSFARTQQLRPQNQTRVRGLFGADSTRDFWQTEIPLDAYNISGVEIQRGPNSILYGLGSPAGIINYSLKTPLMQDNKYSAELRYDNNGSLRGSVDLNQAIAPGTLAVRVNALDDDHKYRQDGKYEKNERVTFSPRWTPKLADSVYTQFTLNYEKGRQRANQPTIIPPLDNITNWYKYMDKYTYPDEFAGTPAQYAPYVVGSNGAGTGSWYDAYALVFANPNSSATGGTGIADAIRQRGGSPFGTFHGIGNFVDNSINSAHVLAQKSYFQNNPRATAIINAAEQASGTPFVGFTGWQGRQILDTSIFDYWNRDLAGPSNTTWQDFNTLNFSAVQTYLNGRAGIELVYDKQDYEDGYNRYMAQASAIGVDINRYLRAAQNADGTLQPALPNPNFGRPFVYSGATAGNAAEAQRNVEMRENYRGTLFYKLNLEQVLNTRNWLTRVIGEQTFTGMASQQRFHHYNENWELYSLGTGFGPYGLGEGTAALHYLNSSVDPKAATTAAGLGITGVGVLQQPPANISVQILDQRPQVLPNVPQFTTVNADTLNASTNQNKLWTGMGDNKTKTTSKAFIWQSRFFDDTVVGLFGLRKDDFEKRIKGSETSTANGRQPADARNDDPTSKTAGRPDPHSPLWVYDPANDLSTAGTTRTYGVMLHSPEFINRYLPWGSTISLGYNEASNLNPNEVGFNVFHQPVAPASGDSKDYTVLITTLHDRISMRATWYKTVQHSASSPLGPTAGAIGESLTRTLNGLMVEASYGRGNARISTIPENIVNKWFFGGNPAQNSSGYFVPGQWDNGNAASKAAMLSQPLLVRAAAATWGDPTSHLNADGSVVGQPSISQEEIDYRKAWYAARTDAEWFRPLGDVGTQLAQAYQFTRQSNGQGGFTWGRTDVPSFKNTTDIVAKGLELELTANVTKNWRVSFNASRAEASYNNILDPAMTKYYTAMKAVAQDGYTAKDIGGGNNWVLGSDYWHRTGFAQIDEWGDEGPVVADPAHVGGTAPLYSASGSIGQSGNRQMLGAKWTTTASGGFGIESAYIGAKDAEGRAVQELRKWRFNFVTGYDFTQTRLKGLGVGGAVRYQGKITLGYYPKYLPEFGSWVNDLDKPIFGPKEVNYDAWIYYRHKLTKKVDLTVQLNLRNLFSGKDLIPINSNPDGTYGQYRLGSTFGWQLSTKFDF